MGVAVDFVKMEGLGNDFVVLEGPRSVEPSMVVELCDRRRGVGADGVLVVTRLGSDRVRMEYWNADGSAAEMCGNGLRCVARYAHDRGWTESGRFQVETAAGVRRVEVDGDEVLAELGPASVDGDGVDVAGEWAVPARVGNPHAVVFVDDPTVAPVETLGPRIETDPLFPDGANVEFARVRPTGEIDLRVWERGVGETPACGTGAAATVAVAHHLGRAPADTVVHLPGGALGVRLEASVAWLRGPATTVFEGTWLGRVSERS
jgi:diaminopimelate epimerase